MKREVLVRVILSRHLYELSRQSLSLNSDFGLFSSANLAQDAVEAFLLAVCDHVSAEIKEKTPFDQYFELIKESASKYSIPSRAKLLRLNKIRVSAKHHGIQPPREEIDSLLPAVLGMFEEVCADLLGVNFHTVGLIDLLEPGEPKDLLLKAKEALESRNLPACAINCRKAIYLVFEYQFDISAFREGAPKAKGLGALWGPSSRAPYYAQNKEYIAKYVREPTNYIVIDHGVLETRLLGEGIAPHRFWNLWRLTPEVWRDEQDRWFVKEEYSLINDEFLEENVDYIFSTAVDLVLASHTKKREVRQRSHNQMSFVRIKLARPEVPLYEKADSTSASRDVTPPSIVELDANFRVPGLDGGGPYWHVMHIEDDLMIMGYIHADDVAK